MKNILRFIASTILFVTTAFAQQAFVSGSIPPYASGSVSELNGLQIISSASINQNGYFNTAISSTPTHTFRVNPVAGSAYAPFSVTVTVSTSGTTDISSTLLANIPSPTPTPFPSISVLTPYVTIDSITYKWPATQGSGCLSNDGSGNFSWIACSSSSGTVTSVSALAPLFTTTTPTTAATFVLSTQVANSVFGNFTGSAAAPTFSAAPVFSAANLTNLPLASPSPIGNTTPNSGAFTTVTATGNVNVQGAISSTTNTQPASITNSGVVMTANPNVADLVYYDSVQTTDNHIVEGIWFQGAYQLRMKSDSQAQARAFFTATGGYGVGSAVLALTGNTTVNGNLNTTGNANSTTLSASGLTTLGTSALGTSVQVNGTSNGTLPGLIAVTDSTSAAANTYGYSYLSPGLPTGGSIDWIWGKAGSSGNSLALIWNQTASTATNNWCLAVWGMGATCNVQGFLNGALKSIKNTLDDGNGNTIVFGTTNYTVATGTAPLTVTSTTPVANLTLAGVSQVVGLSSSLPLSGTTGSIGGSALLAGACAVGTATVTGATTSMVATTSPSSDPDSTLTTGVAIYSFVSAADTVTVRICAIVAVTPAATTYNVRVIQ